MAWDNPDLQRYFRNLMDEYREVNSGEVQKELRKGQAELAKHWNSGVHLMRIATAYAGKALYEPSLETIERFKRACQALNIMPNEQDLAQLLAQIERQVQQSEPHVKEEIDSHYRRHATMAGPGSIAQQVAGSAMREVRRRIEQWKLELRADGRRAAPHADQPPAPVKDAMWFLDPRNWRRHWKAIALAVVISAIASSPAWFPSFMESLRPKFQFQTLTVLRGRGVFVQFTNWSEGWRADSIDIAIYLRLTNMDSRTRKISRYEIEVESSEGWRRVDRVELVPPAILERRAGRDAKRSVVDFRRNNIDAQVRGHPIEAGQSIEGWAFLTSAGGSEYLRSIRRLRMTLFDTLGSRSQAETTPPDSTRPDIGIAALELLSPDWTPPWRGGKLAPPDTSIGTISMRNLSLTL